MNKELEEFLDQVPFLLRRDYYNYKGIRFYYNWISYQYMLKIRYVVSTETLLFLKDIGPEFENGITSAWQKISPEEWIDTLNEDDRDIFLFNLDLLNERNY